MSRVITFSRTFPSYHPRKGELTYFAEKFWNSNSNWPGIVFLGKDVLNDEVRNFLENIREPKHHTIRAGHRFKAGDYFSPRVWSGKPYNSKQIIIAPDTLIVKTFDFELRHDEYLLMSKKLNLTQLKEVAKNDGLSSDDLELWFQKPFTGQVICWTDKINYK